MSSAEHIVENLIMGMKRGREPEDIMADGCNKWNLEDCSLTYDDAVRIAIHVVYGLYDGLFPTEAYEEMTNADNLRRMNDNELIDWFFKHWASINVAPWCDHPCPDSGNCRECVSEWLLKKVDNG